VKVVDTFMFHNEFDILELRLSIMYDHVDRFVIVEGNHTHSGVFKGFQLEEQMDRYAKWADKIQYIKADGGTFAEAWDNEHWQRDQMAQGWTDLGAQDVILVTDCDEIIRPEAIDYIRATNYGCYMLMMPAFYFKLNYLDTKPDWHYKAWGRAYRGYQTKPSHMRFQEWVPGRPTIKLHHAGWHWGWLGDDEFVRTKIKSFAHQEINRPDVLENVNIEQHIAEGRDHFRPENKTWVPVKMDNYFPQHILDNQEKYSKYIIPNGEQSVKDFWTAELLDKEPYAGN
jgi:hypothetical protein